MPASTRTSHPHTLSISVAVLLTVEDMRCVVQTAGCTFQSVAAGPMMGCPAGHGEDGLH